MSKIKYKNVNENDLHPVEWQPTIRVEINNVNIGDKVSIVLHPESVRTIIAIDEKYITVRGDNGNINKLLPCMLVPQGYECLVNHRNKYYICLN